MDGWCIGIIFDDFTRAYLSLKTGKPQELGPVTPFRSYIQWLERQDKQEGLQYWQKYLEGYRQPASFRKTGQMNELTGNESYQVKRDPFLLDETTTAGLNEIAVKYQVTMNSLFRTLWGILLQKYNNTGDVIYGAVVSGRSPEVQGIEHMVGLFINTVPVRIKKQGDQQFSRLLQEVQHQAILSNAYEYVPLAEIQAGCLLKGNLFDHIVVFENYPLQVKPGPGEEQTTGFEVENMEANYQTNYHLSIIVNPGKYLSLIFGYNRLVYEDYFIKRLEEHFFQVIKQVIKNPETPIKDIEILTEEEKARILAGPPVETGDTGYDF